MQDSQLRIFCLFLNLGVVKLFWTQSWHRHQVWSSAGYACPSSWSLRSKLVFMSRKKPEKWKCINMISKINPEFALSKRKLVTPALHLEACGRNWYLCQEKTWKRKCTRYLKLIWICFKYLKKKFHNSFPSSWSLRPKLLFCMSGKSLQKWKCTYTNI